MKRAARGRPEIRGGHGREIRILEEKNLREKYATSQKCVKELEIEVLNSYDFNQLANMASDEEVHRYRLVSEINANLESANDKLQKAELKSTELTAKNDRLVGLSKKARQEAEKMEENFQREIDDLKIKLSASDKKCESYATTQTSSTRKITSLGQKLRTAEEDLSKIQKTKKMAAKNHKTELDRLESINSQNKLKFESDLAANTAKVATVEADCKTRNQQLRSINRQLSDKQEELLNNKAEMGNEISSLKTKQILDSEKMVDLVAQLAAATGTQKDDLTDDLTDSTQPSEMEILRDELMFAKDDLLSEKRSRTEDADKHRKILTSVVDQTRKEITDEKHQVGVLTRELAAVRRMAGLPNEPSAVDDDFHLLDELIACRESDAKHEDELNTTKRALEKQMAEVHELNVKAVFNENNAQKMADDNQNLQTKITSLENDKVTLRASIDEINHQIRFVQDSGKTAQSDGSTMTEPQKESGEIELLKEKIDRLSADHSKSWKLREMEVETLKISEQILVNQLHAAEASIKTFNEADRHSQRIITNCSDTAGSLLNTAALTLNADQKRDLDDQVKNSTGEPKGFVFQTYTRGYTKPASRTKKPITQEPQKRGNKRLLTQKFNNDPSKLPKVTSTPKRPIVQAQRRNLVKDAPPSNQQDISEGAEATSLLEITNPLAKTADDEDSSELPLSDVEMDGSDDVSDLEKYDWSTELNAKSGDNSESPPLKRKCVTTKTTQPKLQPPNSKKAGKSGKLGKAKKK